MGWIKKSIFAMVSMFILFTLIQIFGSELFAPEFLGFGGLLVLVSLGVFETNLVTYS